MRKKLNGHDRLLWIRNTASDFSVEAAASAGRRLGREFPEALSCPGAAFPVGLRSGGESPTSTGRSSAGRQGPLIGIRKRNRSKKSPGTRLRVAGGSETIENPALAGRATDCFPRRNHEINPPVYLRMECNRSQ